jgi:hypothetical protein
MAFSKRSSTQAGFWVREIVQISLEEGRRRIKSFHCKGDKADQVACENQKPRLAAGQ